MDNKPIIRWHGGSQKITGALEAEVRKRVALAAESLKGQVQKNLSVSARSAGPSKPGEFPHADTGRLRQNVFWGWLTKTSAKVGTNLWYGLHHEMDTGRSYLRRTLFEMQNKIKQILTTPTGSYPSESPPEGP